MTQLLPCSSALQGETRAEAQQCHVPTVLPCAEQRHQNLPKLWHSAVCARGPFVCALPRSWLLFANKKSSILLTAYGFFVRFFFFLLKSEIFFQSICTRPPSQILVAKSTCQGSTSKAFCMVLGSQGWDFAGCSGGGGRPSSAAGLSHRQNPEQECCKPASSRCGAGGCPALRSHSIDVMLGAGKARSIQHGLLHLAESQQGEMIPSCSSTQPHSELLPWGDEQHPECFQQPLPEHEAQLQSTRLHQGNATGPSAAC